jgi:hypothetical protein
MNTIENILKILEDLIGPGRIPSYYWEDSKRIIIQFIKNNMNSKKKVADASLEEILSDISNWEDPDQTIMMSPTKDGGVFMSDYEVFREVQANTIREAFIQYGKKMIARYEDQHEFFKLDWSDV